MEPVVPLKQLKAVADGYGVGVVGAAHKVASGAMSPADGAKSIATTRASLEGHAVLRTPHS